LALTVSIAAFSLDASGLLELNAETASLACYCDNQPGGLSLRLIAWRRSFLRPLVKETMKV
jgi:hypothetical protein